MCCVLNFYLAGSLSLNSLPDNEGVRVEQIAFPEKAHCDILHRDFQQFYQAECGTFLRADDGGCCYGTDWSDTYRHLARLVLECSADWGSLYFAFVGEMDELRSEKLLVDCPPEHPERGTVYTLDAGEAEAALRFIPEPAQRAREAFQEPLTALTSVLPALVGRRVLARCVGGKLFRGLLDFYSEEFGYLTLFSADGRHLLVPQQIWEIHPMGE